MPWASLLLPCCTADLCPFHEGETEAQGGVVGIQMWPVLPCKASLASCQVWAEPRCSPLKGLESAWFCSGRHCVFRWCEVTCQPPGECRDDLVSTVAKVQARPHPPWGKETRSERVGVLPEDTQPGLWASHVWLPLLLGSWGSHRP